MRLDHTENGTRIWLSANDTYKWSTKPGAVWPCSQLRNRRLFAEFDRHGDLVDLCVDGGRGDQDIDSTEFNACITDHLPDGHPAAR